MVESRAEQRTGTLTTTEASVLALLAMEGERSGYELGKLAAKSIAYVWAPTKSGLYAVLPRLVRAGYARRRVVRQSARPDKQLYRITRDGREALDRWQRTVEPGAVETFFLKLFVGGLASDDVLLEHVEQFRRETEERLAEYRRIEPTNSRQGHDFYHYLLLRLGIERTEQSLQWADWVAEQLEARPR